MNGLELIVNSAMAKFKEEFGEDAKLEDGDRFVTVYNDAVLIISLENQQLKFDILAGTPYFVDMNLNLTK